MKGSKHNNAPKSSDSGGGSKAKGTMPGPSGGVTMSNERRSDVTKPPSSKNPYPNGLA